MYKEKKVTINFVAFLKGEEKIDTREAIENRRSIRKFTEKDISEEMIKDILDCGRLAPSAKNRQPWYFIVLKGKRKNQIADLLDSYEKEMNKEGYELNSTLILGYSDLNIKMRPRKSLEEITDWYI